MGEWEGRGRGGVMWVERVGNGVRGKVCGDVRWESERWGAVRLVRGRGGVM